MKKFLFMITLILCIVILNGCQKSEADDSDSIDYSDLPVLTQTQKPTESVNNDWKDPYLDYISGEDIGEDTRFTIEDTDESGIPEMYCRDSDDKEKITVILYSPDKKDITSVEGTFTSCYNGHIYSISDKDGTYTEKVYEVSDDTVKCVFDGQYSTNNADITDPASYTYKYRENDSEDYKDISYDDYNAKLSAVYDKTKAVELSYDFDMANIKDIIETY